jgi:predicted enzyme related to lactoylglutathione lyase
MSVERHRPSGFEPGGLCWIDLATTDTAAAGAFYAALLGWSTAERHAGRGRFITFARNGTALASLYQLTREQIAGGVPSHWMPYVAVPSADTAAARACALGGQLIVPPQDVADFARICLIADPTGAMMGLWQADRPCNGGRCSDAP